MVIKSEDFFETMLNLLPSTVEEYKKSVERKGRRLETVIIEDIFMPEIINFLKENNNKKLLEEIFAYFEQVVMYGDEHIINILSITALEVLGNDKQILKTAKIYMGPKTTELQIEADRDLGRVLGS